MQINRVLMEDKTSLMSGWFQCFYRSLKLVFVEKNPSHLSLPPPLGRSPAAPQTGRLPIWPRQSCHLSDGLRQTSLKFALYTYVRWYSSKRSHFIYLSCHIEMSILYVNSKTLQKAISHQVDYGIEEEFDLGIAWRSGQAVQRVGVQVLR